MRRIGYLAMLPALAAALTLASCGGGEVEKTVDAPQEATGPTVVDVKLDEYAFIFDPGEITDGDIVFNIENIGEYPHQFRLVQVPAGPSLMDLVDTDERERVMIAVNYYGGYQYLRLEVLDPGEKLTMSFPEPLAPSLYTLICFARIPVEEPLYSHALRGMVADFNVPPPPS